MAHRGVGQARCIVPLAILFSLVACTTDEQDLVLVDLKTSYRPGIEFSSVDVLVTPEVGATIQESRSVTAADDFIAGTRVAEVSLASSGNVTVRLILRNAAGSLVADGTVTQLVNGATGIAVEVSQGCGVASDSAVPDGSVADTSVADTGNMDAVVHDTGADTSIDARLDAELDGGLVCTGLPESDVCCPSSCGVCGGTGCHNRPGGASACCRLEILFSGRSCKDSPPPCVMLDPAPANPCTGLLAGRICCETSCGMCGGTGCDSRPGGAEGCCGGNILAANRDCATSPPPCVLMLP